MHFVSEWNIAGREDSWEVSPEGPPRIFLDCTPTIRNGGNTGIQRVVRNLIQNGPAAARELGLTCIPVVHCYGSWYCIGSHPPQDIPADVEPQGWAQTGATARRFLLWFLKRLRKAFIPRRLFHFWTKLSSWAVWRAAYRRVVLRPNDVLLLPDAGWGQPEPVPLAEAKRRGVRVGLVLYDLIPILFPQFWVAGFPEIFENWLRQTLEYADFCVAISQSVQQELCEYLARERGRYEHLKDQISWFPLGVSLDMMTPAATIRQELRDVFERPEPPTTFLTVCTLEPRKNHAILLDAFDRLRQQCPETQLCLVGRRGWLCDNLIARITSHPACGKQLHWFSDLSDTELDYCYRHSSALVYPSFAEGFGLPVIEALRYGLTVLASDIPVHREVGSGFCHLFDPHSAAELTRLMQACVGKETLPSVRPPTEFRPTDWFEASLVLLRESLRLASSVPTTKKTSATARHPRLKHEAA